MNKLAALLCLAACAADPKPPPLDCADCDGKADGTNPTTTFAGLTVNKIEGDLVASHHVFMAIDATKFGLAATYSGRT